MIRKPAWAGRFYPDDSKELARDVEEYLRGAEAPAEGKTLLAMVPHAGYMFSGGVAGKTLGTANLAKTIVLLGPNHTGMGTPFSVWDEGRWEVPGGALDVNAAFATALLATDSRFTSDCQAHLSEHSLEVMIPFLRAIDPEATIVPVSVSNSNPQSLVETGRLLARVISDWSEPVSILVSSDMSHMIPADRAQKLDHMAIDCVTRLDPSALFSTVMENRITMCGVLPMTMGLEAACALGATHAELVAYANSGDVLGDHSEVVGYAGMLVA